MCREVWSGFWEFLFSVYIDASKLDVIISKALYLP